MARSQLTQIERSEPSDVKPLLLFIVEMGSLILRWSTRDFIYKYGSTREHFEGRVLSVEGLGEQSAFDTVSNAKVTLQLANEPFQSFDYLSQLNDYVEFQRGTVSVYEILLTDDSEVFSDVDSGRILKWKGCIERLYEIDTKSKTFKLDCCSRLHSFRNSMGLTRVTTDQFPYADKTAVGQWRNLPIGDIEMVPCKLLKTGAIDTLFATLTAGSTATTLIVSGSNKVPWRSSGTFQIDDEQFTYTSYSTSTRTFSGVSRAANGTEAVKHQKGASVYQVLSEFIYEASCVPVGSITGVLVDNVRQTIDNTNLFVYTGRPGSTLTGGYGACARFITKPVVKKQVNVTVDVEHSHNTAEGSHTHTVSGSTTVTRTGIATDLITGYVIDPDYCRDGDNTTDAYMATSYSHLGDAFFRLVLNNSTDVGAISAITVSVRFSVDTRGSGVATIRYGGHTVASFTQGQNLGVGRRTYYCNPAAGWGGALDFACTGGGYTDSANLSIYEASVIIVCGPTAASSPASGVSASRYGSTALGGNSVAEVVIGKEVILEIKGPRDIVDCTGLTSGAITGTPNKLIETLPDVLKYLLCSRMKISLDDIGDSFDDEGSWYETNDYNHAFLANDISTDAQKLITELCSQSMACIYEWGGKFEIKRIPNFDPGSYDFEVLSEDIVTGPIFSYQTLSETANRLMVMFGKDYRTYKESGASVQGPIKSDAADAGFLDYLENGWGAQDLDETTRLTTIRESATAQKYLDWQALRKKLPEKTVSIDCIWRETQVTPGMTFYLENDVEGSGTYLVTNYQRNEQSKTIHIEGVLLPKWNADDLHSETYADEDIGIIQTHVVVAQDMASGTVLENIGCLIFVAAQDLVSETISDNPSIVQAHVIVGSDLYSNSFLDKVYLASAWAIDIDGNIVPSGLSDPIGWWETDGNGDLMPRATISGNDEFWEADINGDLMPKET